MQSRLRNYTHALLSFEHNIFNLGLHKKGRYCGFDVVTYTADAMTFRLKSWAQQWHKL